MGIRLVKKGDGGGGHWLVQMEWRPVGWSVCLPLLIFPLHHKVQKFSSGTGSPGWSWKKGRKTVVCVCLSQYCGNHIASLCHSKTFNSASTACNEWRRSHDHGLVCTSVTAATLATS